MAASPSSSNPTKEGLVFQKITANNLKNRMPLPPVNDEEESRLRLGCWWLGTLVAKEVVASCSAHSRMTWWYLTGMAIIVQVAQLRQRFFHSISPGGLAGERRGVVPASGFSFSAKQIWKVIKENKDLDLPAHKVMVATVRCEEIANQKFKQLVHDEGWLALQEAVETGPVQGFGKRLSSILATYLSEYDMEAIYFDEGVRNSKRQPLESKALDFVYPAYSAMLGHLRSKALEDFQVRLEQSLNKGEGFSSSVRTCAQSSMIEFEKGCADAAIKQANWDASKVREKLRCDIDARAALIRSAKLAELNSNYEKKTFFVFKWSCRISTRNWCKRHLGFDTKTT